MKLYRGRRRAAAAATAASSSSRSRADDGGGAAAGDGGGERDGSSARTITSLAFSTSTVAVVLAAVAVALQGCDVPHITGYLVTANFDIATHSLPDWRAAPDYWVQNSYLDPDNGHPTFNSCMNPMLSIVEVCSGHGTCAPFDPDAEGRPVFFCRCDPEWGGVECSDRRKRQSIAWLWSLFFGPLGLDELYLGLQQQALHKMLLCLLGALIAAGGATAIGVGIVGVTWMFDVVRIGLGPVVTNKHRVQTDLPRFAFASITICFFCIVGTSLAVAAMYRTVLARRRHHDHMQCYSSTKLMV